MPPITKPFMANYPHSFLEVVWKVTNGRRGVVAGVHHYSNHTNNVRHSLTTLDWNTILGQSFFFLKKFSI